MLAPLLALALAAAPPLPSARPAPAHAMAGAALEAGRPDEALAALGADRRPEARLLRGLAEEVAGRPEPALAALAGLERALPAVADRILSARGRVQAGLTRWREAEAAFGAVAEGSLLRGAALVGRARALEAQGERAAALAALAPLLEARAEGPAAPPAAALLLAGRLRAALPTPDLAGARAILLDCWAGHGAEPDSAGCLEALRALPGSAGAPPPLEELVRRGEALLERGRPSDAVALLQPAVRAAPAPGPGQPLACRAAAALGRALRRDRQNGRSAEVLKPVVERCQAGPIRERALYVMASAAAAAGRRDEAVALYRRFAREAPSSTLADDALFAVAELQARDGRPEQARTTLEALLRELPAGDRRDEARFRLAWLAWRAGEAERAVAELQTLDAEAAPEDAYEHARAAYWRGRILEGRGAAGRAEARALWAGLVEAAPADYYALLARARLAGREDAALPAPLGAGARADPLAAERAVAPLAGDRHLLAGLALLRAGLQRPAAEELRAVERGALPPGELAPLVGLAELLERAGDLSAAHNLLRLGARAELRRPPEGANRRLWEVAYPQAFAVEVAKATAPAGVPPELLLALMREESALDPEVVSAAGAVGLTQLMPATARAVARRNRWPAPERAALTDPATSIRIGSAYLGELLVRFKGSPALALAAYNAGENAVERWRSAATGRPLDEFVEEIPYDETRGYVKRVLRSYASYRLLAAGSAAAGGPTSAAP